MVADGELWGDFLKQTGVGNETKTIKSDLDLSPIANLSFVDSDQKPIGGVYNLDVILDTNNNLMYAINPNTMVVSDASGKAVGSLNVTDYSLLSNDNKTVLGQIVLKHDKIDNDTVLDNPAPASSTAANGAGSTLPTAAAALVIPFFLLMV